MCQTAEISHQIIRLGTRTYRQRLEAVKPSLYRVGQLSRLNHDLGSFYETLYGQMDTITPEDYRVFGCEFDIMLSTIKELYSVCQELPASSGFSKETERLGRNYSALYEINSDIKNFRVNSAQKQLKLYSDVANALSDI